MTTQEIIKLFAEIVLIFIGTYAIYREKDIAKLERKAAKYIKAFFKALFYTVKNTRTSKKVPSRATEYRNDEYDEMLRNLNKNHKTSLDDILVA